ncbi:MAG: PhoPQ-activated protein PqaA family protein [Planctomycetota bacterium]
MLRSLIATSIAIAVASLLLSDHAYAKPPQPTTALDRYVAKPDDSFAWQEVSRRGDERGEEIVLELTSQTWRSPGEVDRAQWKHWLILCVPNGATSDTALLFIRGGSNQGGQPAGAGELTRKVALATRSVVAELGMVPNQPLEIGGDGEDRFEDGLLARSWVEYFKTGDEEWIAQLPMAKSAVRAMDAVQAAMAGEESGPKINQFVVTGGSKRGWTTWLTAAVDDRVVAIAPLVIDMLNFKPSMRHHKAVYGTWSKALQDYEEQGIAERLDDSSIDPLRAIVDPFEYRTRYARMPKCLINSAGDEFFLPDSSRYYFDQLTGEKHLCYVPNTGHSLKHSNAIETLIAFHTSVVAGLSRPTIEWSQSPDGGWAVRCSASPSKATLWRAVNPEARDFRHPVIGDAYEPTILESDGGVYRVPSVEPPEGFAATFATFEFNIGAATPWRISTPVWVTPDVEPFAAGN